MCTRNAKKPRFPNHVRCTSLEKSGVVSLRGRYNRKTIFVHNFFSLDFLPILDLNGIAGEPG